MNLPINTIKTAGVTKPINGTKIDGKNVEKSDVIIFLRYLYTLVSFWQIMSFF